jgi:unsaturated chondroitin disaccharide hydrolase
MFCSTEKAFDPNEVLDYCVTKATASAKRLKEANRMSRNIDHDKKEWNTVGVREWTSGFWQGVLWYCYEYSSEYDYR